LDTETHPIRANEPIPRLVCVSTCDGGDPDVLHRDGRARGVVEELLVERDVGLVGHNMAFDMAVLARQWPDLAPAIWAKYRAGRIGDTGVVDRLLCIREGRLKYDPAAGARPRFRLEDLARRHLGVCMEGKDGGGWRERYEELDGVPVDRWPGAAVEYAKEDARITFEVWLALQKLNVIDSAAQARAAFALALMGYRGVCVDAEALAALGRSLTQRQAARLPVLQAAGLLRANGKRDLRAIEARITAAYGGAPARTPKGSVLRGGAVLRASRDPALATLADWEADSKLKGTFMKALAKAEGGVLRAHFNVLVETGRTSCANPNLQNLPRTGGIRECLVPRPGYVLVAADYGMAELCALAQILLDRFGRSAMAEALIAGRDLHVETAAAVLGCSYDEALAGYKAGEPRFKHARQLAKAANFGFPGGLGAARFREYAASPAYRLNLTVEEARLLKGQWLRRYPEMRQYFDAISACTSAGLFTLVQPRSCRLRGRVGYTDGCNSPFQGLTADGAKQALFDVSYECYADPSSALAGCYPVVFVHDELLLEVPVDRVHEAAQRLVEVMVAAMRKWLPDVPVTADVVAMTRWSKDAVPVRDAGGRLIAWDSDRCGTGTGGELCEQPGGTVASVARASSKAGGETDSGVPAAKPVSSQPAAIRVSGDLLVVSEDGRALTLNEWADALSPVERVPASCPWPRCRRGPAVGAGGASGTYVFRHAGAGALHCAAEHRTYVAGRTAGLEGA